MAAIGARLTGLTLLVGGLCIAFGINPCVGFVGTGSLASRRPFVGIDWLKSALQEKQDELAEASGYTRVPDSRLDAFSDYVFQDMEQADQVITISLVTLLLIVILIVLIVR